MPKKRRVITAEDLYKFELITDIHLSPDGKHVIYSQQRVDRSSEKKFTNLWITRTSGGRPKQFTYGDHVDSHPRFSPDGNEIAFISNRGDEKQMQIYIIPFGGGEARQLTKLKGVLGGFEWSPDGKLLVMQFTKKDKESIELESDEKKKKLGVVNRHYDRVFFKFDGIGFLPHERTHIWTVNTRSGKADQLTDGKVHDESEPHWSPDGKHILYSSNRSAEPDLNPYEIDFFIMPRDGGRSRKIPTPIGQQWLASFSPDGKWIAYFGTEGKGDWWQNTKLYVVPSSGKDGPRNLTKGYDFDAVGTTINDVIGALQMKPPVWSNDGKYIYFQVGEHGNTGLKKIMLDSPSHEVEDVLADNGAVGGFQLDKSGGKIVYYFGHSTDPGQIYVRDLKAGTDKKLTRVNEALIRSKNLGEIEEVWFKGAAKNDLQGWILKPPGFNPKRKYPAILEIHGGPWVQYGNLFMHEFHYLAASGYVVFFCNPRGGKGYGEKHAKAIMNGC